MMYMTKDYQGPGVLWKVQCHFCTNVALFLTTIASAVFVCITLCVQGIQIFRTEYNIAPGVQK